jgi:hypothetical protein
LSRGYSEAQIRPILDRARQLRRERLARVQASRPITEQPNAEAFYMEASGLLNKVDERRHGVEDVEVRSKRNKQTRAVAKRVKGPVRVNPRTATLTKARSRLLQRIDATRVAKTQEFTPDPATASVRP